MRYWFLHEKTSQAHFLIMSRSPDLLTETSRTLWLSCHKMGLGLVSRILNYYEYSVVVNLGSLVESVTQPPLHATTSDILFAKDVRWSPFWAVIRLQGRSCWNMDTHHFCARYPLGVHSKYVLVHNSPRRSCSKGLPISNYNTRFSYTFPRPLQVCRSPSRYPPLWIDTWIHCHQSSPVVQ